MKRLQFIQLVFSFALVQYFHIILHFILFEMVMYICAIICQKNVIFFILILQGTTIKSNYISLRRDFEFCIFKQCRCCHRLWGFIVIQLNMSCVMPQLHAYGMRGLYSLVGQVCPHERKCVFGSGLSTFICSTHPQCHSFHSLLIQLQNSQIPFSAMFACMPLCFQP